MGLDCSHNAWHGAYSAFMRWRKKIAQVAGIPPLQLMEGFYFRLDGSEGLATLYHGPQTGKPHFGDGSAPLFADIDAALPIKWEALAPSPLHALLAHSDCDGEIEAGECAKIADALEAIIPLLPDEDAGGHIGNWRQKTALFVSGLRAAATDESPLLFR